MAYAFTVAIVQSRAPTGLILYYVTITETECAAASEWNIPNLPTVFTVLSYTAQRTAGSATTLRPALGKAAAFTTTSVNFIGQQAAAAAFVNDQSAIICRGTGTLYGHTTPDVGADNSVTTEIILAAGPPEA